MMNKMQMMNLTNHIDKLWYQGDYRGAVHAAQMKLGADELEDTFGDRSIENRETLLEDLDGELQYQAAQLATPDDETFEVQKVIDAINEVQGRDDYLYDTGLGLLYGRPLALSDFIAAVKRTNEVLSGTQNHR